MYAVSVSIFGGIFFRNHYNGANGKLHSLQKNNWLRIAVFPLFRKLFWHLLCKMYDKKYRIR